MNEKKKKKITIFVYKKNDKRNVNVFFVIKQKHMQHKLLNSNRNKKKKLQFCLRILISSALSPFLVLMQRTF